MEITLVFSGEKVYSNSKEAMDLSNKSSFGEFKDGRVFYSLVEALYLTDVKKAEIVRNKKKISFESFISVLRRIDKRIEGKYAVFKDLRSKGYVLKSALKFGADFRVYDKGRKPGEEHARWVLYCASERDKFSWQEFAAKNRVAHSTRKKLLIGVVDEEGSVSYYEAGWIRA